MRFGILGPLRVGGGEATVTAGRDRVVLAMLLLRAGRVVPVEELVDAIWDEARRPPPGPSCRPACRDCDSGSPLWACPPDTIVTDPAGYGIRTAPGELDAEVFARIVDDRPGGARAGATGRRTCASTGPRWHCRAARR